MFKTITLIVSAIVFCNISLHSQEIDQVSIGQSYSLQAYYDLSTGDVVEVNNEDWDIAFSNLKSTDAGIFFNESAASNGIPIQLFVLNDDVEWTDTDIDTSQFFDSLALYNPEQNWSEGAFNSIRDTASALDYGWGSYNFTTHVIEGTRIFVIKKRDQSLIKFKVDQLSQGVFTIRFASLNGSNEKIVAISKNDAGESSLIHFSFTTGEIVSLPTEYDLVFQRYTTLLDAGNNEFIQYTVAGVLLAPGTEAVLADDIDPATVSESDYSHLYSSLPTTIGHEWKYFDLNTYGWSIDDNRAYFVKTRDGELFKLVFYDFEGSSTGITTLQKTNLGTTSALPTSFSEQGLQLYPNPTSDYIQIDGLVGNSQVRIYNTMGTLVLTKQLSGSLEKVEIHQLRAGLYHAMVSSDKIHSVQSFIVSH